MGEQHRRATCSSGIPLSSITPFKAKRASSLSERKSEALTTAISTLKVGDHHSLLSLKRPSSGEIFGEERSLRQAPRKQLLKGNLPRGWTPPVALHIRRPNSPEGGQEG